VDIVNVLLPFVSFVISLIFAFLVFKRYLARRGTHLLIWSIGMVFYGIGGFCEAYYGAFDWNPLVFRLWYLFGAILVAAWPGQGTLCVEIRADDEATQTLVGPLDDLSTRRATQAERAFLRRLEGGCQVPIGAYAQVRSGQLYLRGLVSSLDGTRLLRDEIHGPETEAIRLGTELAERVVAARGEAILEEIRRAS
jgi:hypothetical protein